MILSVVKAALSSEYGAQRVDKEVSGYYLADEISGTYRGMLIAIRDEEWAEFGQYSQSKFVMILKQLASKVNMKRFRKHPRGPKKSAPKRKFDSNILMFQLLDCLQVEKKSNIHLERATGIRVKVLCDDS